MLHEMRTEGCAILVANDRDVEASKAVARIVLGSPGERRYRLLAFEEQPASAKVAGFLPDGVAVEDETVAVVTNGTTTRSAARPAVGSRLGPGTGRPGPGRELDDFAHGITGRLTTLGTRFGPFAPGELRFATFDLADLAERYSIRAVRRFCRIVGAQVRGLRGMAYFFVGRSMDDRLVEAVEHLFDARIDVARLHGPGRFEQRWHVYEYEHTTDWVALEPPE